jgi:hypothetical protein
VAAKKEATERARRRWDSLIHAHLSATHLVGDGATAATATATAATGVLPSAPVEGGLKEQAMRNAPIFMDRIPNPFSMYVWKTNICFHDYFLF